MLLILGMNKWQLKILSIPPAKFPAAASHILDQKLPGCQCVTATVRQHGCVPRLFSVSTILDIYAHPPAPLGLRATSIFLQENNTNKF